MNEISVPVKLQIQNLQSLMSELQGKLSNLKVGSTGFKNLQSVISAIGSEIDRLQIQTSKPFMSEAQFKTAERSVEKLEDQIEKLGLSVSRIKFNDLNLTPQQQSDIKGFEDQLESIKANLKTVKETAKQEFLKTDLGQQWATIDSTAFSKSLSQITANIRSEVNKQEKELERLQAAATSYQNAIAQNKKINDFLQKTNKDPISIGSMGEDLYNQLFDKLKRLKGGKNGGRKLIEEWLQNELELDPEIISKLVKNLHGDNLSAQLTAALQKIMKDNSAVIKANPTAEVDFKQKEQEVQNLINILREAGVSEQSIVVAEQALRQQLDSTKQSFNDYQNAAARAAQENMNVDSTTAAFKSQLTSLRSTLDQTNAKFLQMQRTTQSFNQMKMAITNFMGFNQVLNITKNAVREAMNHIKELDSVMNGISIVTDMTTDDLWKQVDAYSEMAQNYGVSIKGAYEVSQIYYQQGLETNDVLTLTNETLKLAKISGLDYAQTTDYMTTALRGFKMEMSDASTIVDVYSNLAANTAVSQEELAVAMSKTASSMESVGSSFEDTSAMIATMVAVTRESATNIGSAMKSIASRYGELTKDPTKLVDADGEAMAFNKVDSALQSVGISMKTVDGQFRNFTDVIVELAEKWDQLESTQQRYIATQFAGNRQQSRFLALVSNKDILKANMEVANNSEDVGTLQALKALDSIEAKTEQVRVAYQQFYTTIGMQDVWKTFLDGTKNVINTLNRLPKLFGSIPIGAIAAITSVLNLLKNGAVAILNSVAKIWINRVKDISEESKNTFSESGTISGNSFMDKIIEAITGKTKEVQKAGQEVAEAAKAGVESVTPQQQQVQQQGLSGEQTQLLGNLSTKANQINKFAQQGNINQDRLRQVEENSIIQMKNAGLIEQTQAEEALKSAQLGRGTVLQDLINKTLQSTKVSQQNANAINQEGTAAQNSGNKFQQFATSHNRLAGNLQQLSSALTMIGMLWDTSSSGGQAMAGAFSMAAGAVSLFSAALKIADTTTKTIPWMAIASGIIAVINGFSLVIETPAEKLERLNKEAEELSNKAKEVKANYNVLNRSIEKLEELKDKRYESAEAAEEYQTAVDELAEKFPEMIAGFDEAGNIILDTTDAERVLAEAREKSKQATYDAAKAEMDYAKGEADKARNELADLSVADVLSNNEENSTVSVAEKQRDIYNKLQIGNGKIQSVKGLDFNQVKEDAEERILAMLKIYYFRAGEAIDDLGNKIEGFEDNELAENFKFLTQSFDEDGFFSLQKLEEYLTELKDEKTDIESEFYEAFFGKGSKDLLAQYSEKVKKFNEKIKNKEISTEELFTDYNEIENLLEEISKLGIADTSLVKSSLDDAGKQIKADLEKNKIYNAYKKEVVSAWQQSIEANTEAWESLSKSSNAAAMVTKQIINNIDTKYGGDYSKAEKEDQEEWKTYQQNMAKFLNSLNEEELKLFNQMTSDTSTYSVDDIKTVFGQKVSFSSIEQYVIDYYSKGLDSIQTRLNVSLAKSLGQKALDDGTYAKLEEQDLRNRSDFYKEYFKIINEERNELAGIDETYLNNILEQYDSLKGKGYINLANAYGNAALALWKNISNQPQEIENQLWELINKNGITTLEGIRKIQDAIKNNPELSNVIDNELISLYDSIIPNIKLSIQTATSELLESYEDTEKILTKAISTGLDLKDVDALISQMEALGIKVDIDKDFKSNGKGLVLTAKKFEEYWKELNDSAKTNNKEWEQKIKDAKHILESKLRSSIDLEDRTIIEAIVPNFDFNKYLNEYGELTDEGIVALDKAIKDSSDAYSKYISYQKNSLEKIKQSYDWSQGNYSKSSSELQNLTKWDNILGANDPDKEMIEYIQKSYSTLLSDALKFGLDKIDLSNYEGLIDNASLKQNLTKAIEGNNYKYFIEVVGQYAGKSVEEINAAIGDYLELQNKETSGAAQKALQNIDFYGKGKAYGSFDDAKSLADALGISINKILGNYIEGLDQYELKIPEDKLQNITNSGDIFLDSLQSVLESVTDYITSGIQGKLQYKDIGNLNAQLEAFGSTYRLSEADFTKTADGLKLSQEAAIHLYNELEKIDSIQSKIVFNDLSKELQKSNDHYKSTVDLLTHIADLRKTITELEKKKDSTKLQQYKEELAVAEQIAKVRATTEDPSFSFMDKKLEGGLNNPVNYLNAWGKAQSAWNKAIEDAKSRKEAFKKGESFFDDFNVYLDPANFQYIVEELNRVAGQSGTTIEFLGQKLDGSLEAASALIIKGFSTLTTDAGGQAVLNMSALGVSLEDSGKLLNQGAEKAVHEVAKSQIKILDALISVMETVVALEGLTKDNNGDNEFNINDIFPSPESWDLDPKFLKSVQDLLKNKQIIEELKNYKFDNGKTLNDFFNVLANKHGEELEAALKEYGINSQEDLFNIIKQFEGNYDWETNAQTIYEVLKQWIPKELNYEDEQVETITVNDVPIKIDFKEQNTQKALEQLKGTEEQKKGQLLKAIRRYEGAQGTKPLSIKEDAEELIAVLTYKGIVTDVKVDEENNKVTITYNGKEYEGATKEEALQKAILSEAGGENEVEIEDNDGEITGKIKFGNTNITLTAGENGTVHYSLYDAESGQTYTGTSLETLKQDYIKGLMKNNGKSKTEAEHQWNESIKVNTSINGEVQEVTDNTGVNLNTPILTINPEKVEVSSEEGTEPPSAEKVSIKVKDLIITGIEKALLQEGYDGSLTKPFPQVIANLTSLILSSVLGTSLSDPDNLPSPEAITQVATSLTKLMLSSVSETGLSDPNKLPSPKEVSQVATSLALLMLSSASKTSLSDPDKLPSPDAVAQMATSLTKLMFSSVGDAQLSPIARFLLTLYQLDPISAMRATLEILKLIGSPEAQKGDGFVSPTTLEGTLADIEAQINTLKVKANNTDTSDLTTRRDNAVETWKTSSPINSVDVSILALKFALTGATTDEIETKIKEYKLERNIEEAVKVTVPLLSFVLDTGTDENGNPTGNKNIDDEDIQKAIVAYDNLSAGSKTAVLSSLMLSVATENVNSENAKESAVAKLKELLTSLSIPLNNVDLTLGGINLIAGEIQKDETLGDAKNQIISWISQKLTDYNMIPNVDLSGIFINSTGNKLSFADGILDSEGRLKLSELQAAVAVTDLKIALTHATTTSDSNDKDSVTLEVDNAYAEITGISKVSFKSPIQGEGATIEITDAEGNVQSVKLSPEFDYSKIIDPETGKINQEFLADVLASLKDDTVKGWDEWVEGHNTFTVTPTIDNSQDSNNNNSRDNVYLGTHGNETYKYLDPQRKTVEYEAEGITSSLLGSSIGKKTTKKTVYFNDSEVVTYLNNLRTAVGEYNETLSQIDLENLDRLSSLLKGTENENGEDLGNIIQNIISLNQINLANKAEEMGALAEVFQGIDAENLSKAAESMILLASSATRLDKIDWDSIIAGINGINSINTPNPEPNSPDGSNDGVPNDNSIEKKINLDLKLSGDVSAQELIQKQEEPIQRTIELNVTDENINNIISRITLGLYENNNPSNGGQSTGGESSAENTPIDTTGIQNFAKAANQAGNEIGAVATSAAEIKSDKVEAIGKAQDEIDSTNVTNIQEAANRTNSQPIVNASGAVSGVNPWGAVRAQQALNNITGNVAIDVQFNVSVGGESEATGNVVGAKLNGQNINYSSKSVHTRISKSYAKGTRQTLMGELGPELVVSGGRYFVVGQNGAEMVDLDPDAIVFNHLQTKKLLSTGHAGRGKPITNERTATSLATGNFGPAMASASAVLSELKKIRAMWQSMLNASLRDLGSQAGINTKNTDSSSGKSGTSSPDKYWNPVVDSGYIADLERWYNLMRQIEKLEKDINYQEQLRAKLQSDRIIDGKSIFASQKQTLKQLEEEIAAHKELAESQKDYYDIRREILNNETNFGKIFTFNEEGLMQYNDNAIMQNGDRGGLYALAKLNAQNANGEPVFTAREQYELLKQWGFGNDMLYDSSGKKITFGEDEEDDKARFEAEQAGYTAAVEAFWDKADAWKEELDGLYDSYREQQEKILENETTRNNILQQIIDNQLSLEDKIYNAIIDARQEIIDTAQNERDALEKASTDFINGLSKQLNKEREMYKNNQDQENLNKLRRQLGILQRSGGSASAINNLQNQIAQQEQNLYFESQQQQINAIEEASNLEIERLDSQIEIMTEALEYQKENGLLWAQVSSIMAKSSEEISNFITSNGKDWRSYSATRWNEEYRTLNGEVEQWKAYDTDQLFSIENNKTADQLKYRMQYMNKVGTGATTEEAYADLLKNAPLLTEQIENIGYEIFKYQAEEYSENKEHGYVLYPLGEDEEFWIPIDAKDVESAIRKGNETGLFTNGFRVEDAWGIPLAESSEQNGPTIINTYNEYEMAGTGYNYFQDIDKIEDTNGEAIEHQMTDYEIETMKKEFFNNQQNLPNSDLIDLDELEKAISNINNISNTNDSSVNIEQIEINMNNNISNNYDAKQAGQNVVDEILKVARKNGASGLTIKRG